VGIANALRRQIECAMRTLGGAARTVVLRSVSETGGDTLLGVRGTETVTEVTVTPSPFVTNVSYQEVELSQGRLTDGDFSILMPPTGYTKEQIEAGTIIVDGVECHPYKIEEWAVENQVVWIRVLASKKHQVGHRR
jgi:hypothetical protein